jgi:hypothetical protein
VRRASGGEEIIDVPGQFDLRFDAIVAGMGYAGQLAHFTSCFRSGETPRERCRTTAPRSRCSTGEVDRRSDLADVGGRRQQPVVS